MTLTLVDSCCCGCDINFDISCCCSCYICGGMGDISCYECVSFVAVFVTLVCDIS